MTKKEMKRIADKLGWEVKGVETALKELFKEKSMVENWGEFFKLCLEPPNRSSAYTTELEWRKERIFQFLRENLKGNLVETICDLIHFEEPCFYVLAFFNLSSKMRIQLATPGEKTIWELLKKRNSFLVYKLTEAFYPITSINMVTSIGSDELLNGIPLCGAFLSELLLLSRAHGVDLYGVLLEVLARVGFLVFNVPLFRLMASEYSYDPTERDKILEIIKALSDPFMYNRKEITEKRYWFNYALIEKLKGKYGLKGACKKIAKSVTEANSLQTRYFEKKKEAKEKRLSLDDIINQYKLQRGLRQRLEKDSTLSVDLSVTDK